jgi:hypothetical protein
MANVNVVSQMLGTKTKDIVKRLQCISTSSVENNSMVGMMNDSKLENESICEQPLHYVNRYKGSVNLT